MGGQTLILGVETSCDETSAAVIADGKTVLSNVVSSQIPVHQKFGGVVPEIASRKHVELISSVIHEAVQEAKIEMRDISAIAVTYGPGLVGALLVGVSAAKALAYALGIPLIGLNHLEGHIYANFLADPALAFPLMCLVVSGGHTDLVYLEAHGTYTLVGSTRDDAAGEAFDKVARAMGLGYPGGPLIDKLAKEGDPLAVELPRAYLEPGSLDFSFSGLKSASLNFLNKAKMKDEPVNKADLAASFQQAVVDVLVDKALDAACKYKVQTMILAGGVAANSKLRKALQEKGEPRGIKLQFPPLEYCTDNAAMIACAGYYKYLRGQFAPLTLNAVAGLKLGIEQYE